MVWYSKAPTHTFGGKSAIAAEIWRRLGNVDHYIEPFFGSGAVLLARPHAPKLETVNDINGYIVNFWRAVAADAQRVAHHADWPVFECDLHARHFWLLRRRRKLVERLEGDPAYYNARIAGWWVWGLSAWIGGHWCEPVGRWISVNGRLVPRKAGDGVFRQSPSISRPTQGIEGVQRRGVHLSRPGQGVHTLAIKRQRIDIDDSGKGVHRGVERKTPELHSMRGVTSAARADGLYAYFAKLQARLRHVRVCCGDWTRVTGPSVLGATGGVVGMLLDPPYSHDDRDKELYANDHPNLYAEVRAWAIEAGRDLNVRIAYCGLDDGFEWPEGWVKHAWKGKAGYGNQRKDGDNTNRDREVIWFSPGCIAPTQQLSIFDMLGNAS